ncbi:MAG TPA: hypothetical protein VGJ84_09935 [Polyangiaceae bacterium]
MPEPHDRKPKKFQTFTRQVRGFVFFEETTVSTEMPSERPFPAASPNQTSGVETRESLRPSRPGPGLAAVRSNVFLLPAARKTG